jgi:hypothetical protein
MTSVSDQTVDAAPESLTSDRYTIFHLILQLAFAGLLFFSDELDRRLNLYLLLVPLLLIPALVVVIVWLTSVIKNIIRKRWRRLASAVIAPVIIYCLMASLSHWQIDADWVRFQANHRHYEISVESLKGPHPRHVTWDWGHTGGAAVVCIDYELHYDESDLTKLRDGERKGDDFITVRDFGNHFYLVTTLYQ